MNPMNLMAKAMIFVVCAVCLGSTADAQYRPYNPQPQGGAYDRGPAKPMTGDRDPGRPGRGGRSEWELVDEVHFYARKTAEAINNCRAARERDIRCSRTNDIECTTCSEIAHSDHSSYIVYERRQKVPVREFVQTYHFYDKKTAIAYNKCQVEQQRMFECRDSNYECSPCTKESHTDHSQFDLYRITYRYR